MTISRLQASLFQKPGSTPSAAVSVRVQKSTPIARLIRLCQATPHFGGEVIAKVPGLAASNAVYFGEWAPWDGSTGTAHDPDLGMSSSLRTVYYVGENPTSSMPTPDQRGLRCGGYPEVQPGYSGRCLHRYPDRHLQLQQPSKQQYPYWYPERRQLQRHQASAAMAASPTAAPSPASSTATVPRRWPACMTPLAWPMTWPSAVLSSKA